MLPLRSSWFSLWLPSCHQNGGFPLKPYCRVSCCRTGLPLSRHFNPCPAPKDSLEVFPDSSLLFLASFAVTVSGRQQIIPGSKSITAFYPPRNHAKQATLPRISPKTGSPADYFKQPVSTG